MKFVAIVILLFSLLTFSCDEDKSPTSGLKPEYVNLEVNSFMKNPPDVIADSLGSIFSIQPIVLLQNIHNQFEYLAADSSRITVWIDEQLEEPRGVEYLVGYYPPSTEYTYDENRLYGQIESLFVNFDIYLDDTEIYYIRKSSSHSDAAFYEVWLCQTYNTFAIDNSYSTIMIDSENEKIYRLILRRWFYHINEIQFELPTSELKEKARLFFESREDVLYIADDLYDYGYFIAKDKLCKLFGGAVTDNYGSELLVFVDIQNGDIVSTSFVVVGRSSF